VYDMIAVPNSYTAAGDSECKCEKGWSWSSDAYISIGRSTHLRLISLGRAALAAIAELHLRSIAAFGSGINGTRCMPRVAHPIKPALAQSEAPRCDNSRPRDCCQRLLRSYRSRFADDNNAVQPGKERKCGGDAEGVPHVILRFEHCLSSVRFTRRNPPSTVTKLGISPESDGSFGRSNPLNLPSRNLATSGLGVICGNEVPDRSAVEHMLSTASTSPRNA
jgi:hypothetical protein